VPRSAVSVQGESRGRIVGWVYVVHDGKAHRTRVVAGADDGRQVEILSGLMPTDRVVLHPGSTWAEAVPVTVRKGAGAK
jgi:hypothetical protein